MPDFRPLPNKTENAFRIYVRSQSETALDGYEHLSGTRAAPFAVPSVIYAATDDGLKERIPGRGVFEVPLDIYVGTEATKDDPDGEIHQAACGAVIAVLNHKPTVLAAINKSSGVDARAQKDFHAYSYSLRGNPTAALADGNWETVIKLFVIAQGMDIEPPGAP
jgi:hypothetical protein